MFSRLYIDRGRPSSDSRRFRIRLATFADQMFFKSSTMTELRYRFATDIGARLGVKVPWVGTSVSIEKFFIEAEIRDVLDSVTILFLRFSGQGYRSEALVWRKHVEQVIFEENLYYNVDENCIVHLLVDQEFEFNRAAALGALASQRWSEARADFEAAFKHLRNGEGKQAIRMMFPAVEVAFRVMTKNAASRLMPNEAKKNMNPLLEQKYAGNLPAIDAGKQLLEAFEKWIVASQPYRHGQAVENVSDPPLDLVVAHLSTGAAFLRWMIELGD